MESNKWFIALLGFALLYMSWQMGRLYQASAYNALANRYVAPQSVYTSETVHTYTVVEKPVETIVERVEYIPAITQSLEFTVTAYCMEDYPHICNNGDATKTSTGAIPTPNRTIAVDPKIIPYGTQVYIDGMGVFVAEDTFGTKNKGNCIDILMETHKEALQFGRQKLKVWVLND